eukprot:1004018-Rhodomonas_salina.1
MRIGRVGRVGRRHGQRAEKGVPQGPEQDQGGESRRAHTFHANAESECEAEVAATGGVDDRQPIGAPRCSEHGASTIWSLPTAPSVAVGGGGG